jgi:corrinoid protein of di/trimethylamine methyltransferase
MSDLYNKISEAIVAGNVAGVKSLTQQALDSGDKPSNILDEALLPPMDIVGARMKSGEMFIPEVLLSATAMQSGLDVLIPLLGEGEASRKGTVVLGTVEGDLHDIGKNLVGMMLKAAGFNVIDLGTSVKAKTFLEAIVTHNPQILGMSALLTTTMPRMEETIKTLKEAGLRDKLKIIAGGAPVTKAFVEKIGGDAYGPNAAAAVDLAKALVDR